MNLSRLCPSHRHVLLHCCWLAFVRSDSFSKPQRLRPEAACAAYDLHVLTLIEDYALVRPDDPGALAKAAMLIADARVACRTGYFERGLQLYEAVDLAE